MDEQPRGRVLVVDPDRTARALLARVLGDSGWVVETASSARAALAACRRASFAIITIDLGITDEPAGDLARTIAERWPETGIIVVSGPEAAAAAVACVRAGAWDYLMKPLDPDQVALRLDRALERRQLITMTQQHQRHLEAQVRRETRTARRLFLGAIQSLCSALEAKDDYTRGHSERVSRLASGIARDIAASAEEVRRVRLAGRLHDIGKIGVREAVLLKRAALTAEEYQQIQLHPVIGERILGQGLVDAQTVQIVRHHHEHYAGGGYPDGLAGSEIPLGARILAVADAFDALTSDRPYRQRLSAARALAVLREGAGAQWQPTLVEALAQRISRLESEGSS